MTHALPRHVGDVQQAIDAAEVDERAVIGEVLDDALDDRAFLQALQQLFALLGELALDDGAAGDHHVVALAVELDDLELEFLAFEVGRIAHRAHVDQRTRQERADVLDVDGEAALDLAGDPAGDGFLGGRLLQVVPHQRALGLLARQLGFAEAVFDGVEGDLHLVADLDFELASSFLNCSIGTMPSDFRPALTTTTSLRISTTMPETMAPGCSLAMASGSVRTVQQNFQSC